MSTQTGILSTVDSETLWTAPAKEQYLPSYFKELCDQYLSLKNPRRVLPVEVSEIVSYLPLLVYSISFPSCTLPKSNLGLLAWVHT